VVVFSMDFMQRHNNWEINLSKLKKECWRADTTHSELTEQARLKLDMDHIGISWYLFK